MFYKPVFISGNDLSFSDLSGSTSSLFRTHCISSTVSASGLQHKPAHLCPLAALSQVEEWVQKHTGDEGPHWQHVHGGAKVSSVDPAGGEDGSGEERSLQGKAFELSHKEQIGLLQVQKGGKDSGDQMCKGMKHR